MFGNRCHSVGLGFGPKPCWVFTKVTRELLKKWRSTGLRCGGYIDDFNNCHESKEELTRIMNMMVLHDLRACGFIVNMKKTMKEPKQLVRYLGMLINSVKGCINIPDDKKAAIIHLLQQALRSKDKCSFHFTRSTDRELNQSTLGIRTDITHDDNEHICRHESQNTVREAIKHGLGRH